MHTSAPHSHYGDTPFVGRAAELERLSRGLDGALAGRGALYLLAGEPGIGKTRLADEVAQRAAARALDVLWGRCWESGGAPAYWPWVQVLRACATRVAEPALTARLRAAPDLTHILPELRPRVADLAETHPGDPEQARFRILDAATALLRDAAEQRPLVVLLDDLHAADQSSLLLLRFVARELRALPLVVVGAYRETEAARDPQVSRILADVQREGERISLRGLSAEAVSSYLAAQAPQQVTPDTADAVYAVTEGNPLFVSEVVRLWVADHARRGDAGTPPLAIPDELRTAIRRRLDPLPERVRRIVSIAAVQGREFDAALVTRVAAATIGTTAVEISEALEAARAAGVIQPVAEAIERFSFAHVLVRDVLHDALPAVERARLHRALAGAIERMHAGDLAPHLAEIAHHHALAAVDGEVDKAVEFARRAGDRALDMVAYEDAERHFERALAVLALRRDGPRADDRLLQCELLLGLSDALWGAGDLTRLREVCQRVAALGRGLPAHQRGAVLARTALSLGGRQQRAHLVLDVELIGLLEEARAALGEEDSPLRARILARLAYAIYTQPGSRERRARLGQEAVAMARRVGDPRTLHWVLNDWRWARWGPDTLAERQAITDELLRLARRRGDRELELGELAWRMVDQLEQGDSAGFDTTLDAYARIARERREPWYLWYIGRFTGVRALTAGRFAEAEQLVADTLTALKRTPQQDALLIHATQLFAVRAEQGRLAEQEAALQAFMAQYPTVPVWRYVVTLLHAELERPDATRDAFELVAQRDFADLPDDFPRVYLACYLAEACAYLGDARRAALLYDLLQPYAERCAVVGFGLVCLGSVSRYLGMLAGVIGRTDVAAAHFEAALTRHAAMDARPAQARTQLAYARVLLAGAADPAARARAEALLRAAGATAAELGMCGIASRVAALAGAAGFDRGALASAAPPAAPSTSVSTRLRGSFCREGEFWAVGIGARTLRVKHLRGFLYVSHLLRRPGEDVHVFDLLDLADGATLERGEVTRRDSGDAGPLLDATARAAIKARLRDLDEELADAEEANDLGRIERYRAEIEQLADHLAAASGLGGRDRGASTQANRARVAVAKAIRIGLARIAEHDPELAQYLERAIDTGTFCSYTPDPLRQIDWDLG